MYTYIRSRVRVRVCIKSEREGNRRKETRCICTRQSEIKKVYYKGRAKDPTNLSGRSVCMCVCGCDNKKPAPLDEGQKIGA